MTVFDHQGTYLTDGGLETTLIFLEDIELPEFAAIDQFGSTEGRDRLARYYRQYLDLAAKQGTGFVLESPTWRASSDWEKPLGYSADEMDRKVTQAIKLMCELRDEYADRIPHILISGCIGPRSDGYNPTLVMTTEEAADYHQRQIRVMKDAGADMVTAVTMSYLEEAQGIAIAAARENIPAIMSFTVETDGHLITGMSLKDAIESVDQLAGVNVPYHMVNCAHPSHFAGQFTGGDWLRRIQGVRANASRCSHDELDEAEELDWGNPAELGGDYASLMRQLPNLRVLGGCCGTDLRHLTAIANAVAA
ncbi:MAG: homocysteine S-methyltransferase family protein [Pseudomonadota bacterium]